jgi:hypothetical protein
MRKARKAHSKGRLTIMPQTAQGVDLKTAVLKALEDERYDWRTIKGLAKATGAIETEIIPILASLSDQIVRSQDADGRSLFTTREHYQHTHGFGDRLLSALADRIVA